MIGHVTTPPVPSSSPGLTSDGMDISPLPHKAPFLTQVDIQLQSPTPELTPAESSSLTNPSPVAKPYLEPPKYNLNLTIPKKSMALRPHLARGKGYSTSAIPHRLSAEAQLPPFMFGAGLPKLEKSTSMNLTEAFSCSPIQERPMTTASMMPPPARPSFNRLGSAFRNGSPSSQHVRKMSNPTSRPRKQFRRSLSMFENPADVVNIQPECSQPILPSIMDVEIAHVPQLPHFISDKQGTDLPRISKDTLIEVLDRKYNHLYERVVIVDCRFEYEYKGGHIEGAVNYNDKEQLAAQLFNEPATSKALLIFHCEYSAHRAPIMAKFIRGRDRNINAEQYPNLTYPETYILDGGYSSFFKDHRPRCFPQNYVEMDAKEHKQACERGMGRVNQRRPMIRAQTYAFGDHSSDIGSSPTAPCRSASTTSHPSAMDLDAGSLLSSTMSGLSSISSITSSRLSSRPAFFDISRNRTHRMLSY